MKYSIAKIVGFDVEDSYKWQETLFFNYNLASINENDYESCKSFIKISYSHELQMDDTREIADGVYIGQGFIIDKEFGAKIEKKDFGYHLTVSQECNEWLVVCFQLLLLENGYSLIHAAGLEKESKAMLLPSWGGVGKTATVVKMVKDNGWKLLGDDLLIIDSKGNVIPFLKPFVIYGYHEPLFPELFKQKRGIIIRNHSISDALRKFIPSIKKMLRIMPGLLAFARKHNPHSMRIKPSEVFFEEQLSKGAIVSQVTWLERLPAIGMVKTLKNEQIVSKITAVTILEVFGERINAINIMCGSGIFNFSDLYVKMHNVISKSLEGITSTQLTIPTEVPIENVGDKVIEYLEGQK